MRFWRVATTSVLVLAALACVGPPGALASGPSAGDQQYIDPLGGSTTSGSQAPKPSASSSTTSQPSPAPAPTVQSPPQSSAPTVASATATTSADPAGSSTSTLPRTGFDAWLGAGLGLALLGTGALLRRHVRRT